MTLKQRIARSFRVLGYDLSRYEPARNPNARLIKLMNHHEVDLVIDVGANEGQYATLLREHGYQGEIISYEPINEAFQQLESQAAKDPQWQAHNLAIGDENGKSTINISDNSTSSSLLDMLPAHEKAAPQSKYKSTQQIQVRTLDAVFNDIAVNKQNVWLKVDTQGYEKKVLDGASKVLPKISCVQLEMSLVPLYSGTPLFHEILDSMMKSGFKLIGIQPGFTDPETGHLLQADGIFANSAKHLD